MNLRELVEQDLKETLEGEWGLPVVLISPDGECQEMSANDPTCSLVGQVLYDSKVFDPESGAELVVHSPVVTLRRSSLARVPRPEEKWMVQIPSTPSASAKKELYSVERPSQDGSSIGLIRLYLRKLSQGDDR